MSPQLLGSNIGVYAFWWRRGVWTSDHGSYAVSYLITTYVHIYAYTLFVVLSCRDFSEQRLRVYE